MTMITESPDQALKSAIEAVEAAKQLVQDLNGRVHEAEQRANDAQMFVAAARLEYQNADARYLVLKDLLENQDFFAGKLATAKAELAQAKEIEKSVTETRKALGRVTKIAQGLVTSAETTITDLEGLQKSLADAADSAPNGEKAALRNGAGKVGTLHKKLLTLHGRLQNELHTAITDYEAVPEITGIKELEENVKILEKEERSAKVGKGEHLPVSPTDVEKAEAERDNARRVMDKAPEAEQEAQADLRAKQAELAEARTGQAGAMTAFEQVEGEFIDRVVVSEPNAAGWATAQAVLKPDMTIPKNYKLSWQAGGAPIRALSALMVQIDVNALPVGDTTVEVTIVEAASESSS